MLHLKSTMALASALAFIGGSAFAAAPMPASGNAPYMDTMQMQAAPSPLTRAEVQAQAAAEPPAAGQMNGTSHASATQPAGLSERVRVDARAEPTSAELNAMSRTLTVGNLPVRSGLTPAANATASGAGQALGNAS